MSNHEADMRDLVNKLNYCRALIFGAVDKEICFKLLNALLIHHIYPVTEALGLDHPIELVEYKHNFGEPDYESSLRVFDKQCETLLSKLPRLKEKTV